ncbi:helix-turn-helix transcriptional regulator [Mycolicibacterium sp. 018/SC-01/001]|uniref:helix-turn-helix transcriptional regulator n=1 Tax=Mycolicibacterium sp. 018/SC-01/001 TaxID=2592069 RepID=UPI00117D3B01|nr:helix-turn-helix transcriptional regulator [Mycolicibacterium sp. 018/SC-01/001]TRW78209.1 helix-turn-helix transcriptional regulator [Mycolicibacterium sp. 018/SC-01/001]
MTHAESVDTQADTPDPGMVRAGAAAAARRRELDISQRRLAAEGIINAGALIAFEKGRSWPRARTRAKLEEVLQWPPGTIERLRSGASERRREPVPTTSGDESSLIAQAVLTAVGTLAGTVSTLPSDDDPAFLSRISATLNDLRQLEAVAARAARIGRVTPPLIKALGTVRSLYDDLMVRAARAPGAGLGPRLYTARRAANLTVAETAQAAGVGEQVVARAEAGESVSPAETTALETLISQLV